MTLGPKVGEIASRLGLELMPWQQYVLDVTLEVADDGGLVYPESVLTTPRQNGKTALVLSKLIHRARALEFFDGPQNILYTAQDRNHARKKWLEDHVERLDACKAYRRGRDYRVVMSAGGELIKWANGSRHGICAPTDTAAHGETLDEGVIDEAFAHEDDAVEQGMSPAMITRRNSQFFVLSTAGTAKSFYLYRKILTGRRECQSDDGAIAYFEWASADDDDPADPASWRRANPAFGITITEAKLYSEWRKLSADGPEGIDRFRRAHLNVWPEVPVLDGAAHDRVIPDSLWAGCRDPLSQATDHQVFAFDVAPDQAWSAISVASTRSDGLPHIETIEHHKGTLWLTARLAELNTEHKPRLIVCDPSSPAGGFLPELAAARVDVKPVSGREYMGACVALFSDVVNGKVRHIGQSELDSALAGATRKSVSDGWVWDRKSSIVDITPLSSATLALMALKTAPKVRRPLVAVT